MRLWTGGRLAQQQPDEPREDNGESENGGGEEPSSSTTVARDVISLWVFVKIDVGGDECAGRRGHAGGDADDQHHRACCVEVGHAHGLSEAKDVSDQPQHY